MQRLDLTEGLPVEVQHGLRAFLEAVRVDVPQPHAAVHDEEDGLGPQEAHPHRIPVQEDAEVVRGGVSRDGQDVLLREGFAPPADGQQGGQPEEDGRADLVPVDAFR